MESEPRGPKRTFLLSGKRTFLFGYHTHTSHNVYYVKYLIDVKYWVPDVGTTPCPTPHTASPVLRPASIQPYKRLIDFFTQGVKRSNLVRPVIRICLLKITESHVSIGFAAKHNV